MDKIYIIIVNYRNYLDTLDCLDSIIVSVIFNNYQVIIVDSASKNDSVPEIKKWAQKKKIPIESYLQSNIEDTKNIFSTKSGTLVIIEADENKGFAAANNIGIEYALKKKDFDSIILLNNDTIIDNNALKNIVQERKRLGNNAIYGGRIFYYDNPDILWYDGGEYNRIRGKAKHIHLNQKIKEVFSSETHETEFITFCFVLIPKEVINVVGLLDESYFMYDEDLDYCRRVVSLGMELFHVPSAIIYHKIAGASGGRLSEFAAYWNYKNEIRYNLKRVDILRYISIILIIITRPLISLRWIFRKEYRIARISLQTVLDALR